MALARYAVVALLAAFATHNPRVTTTLQGRVLTVRGTGFSTSAKCPLRSLEVDWVRPAVGEHHRVIVLAVKKPGGTFILHWRLPVGLHGRIQLIAAQTCPEAPVDRGLDVFLALTIP